MKRKHGKTCKIECDTTMAFLNTLHEFCASKEYSINVLLILFPLIHNFFPASLSQNYFEDSKLREELQILGLKSTISKNSTIFWPQG